ncbi:MAG: hypothetical protein WCV63_10780 [Negativicutes bacterium]|jgi:hypothetical protein
MINRFTKRLIPVFLCACLLAGSSIAYANSIDFSDNGSNTQSGLFGTQNHSSTSKFKTLRWNNNEYIKLAGSANSDNGMNVAILNCSDQTVSVLLPHWNERPSEGIIWDPQQLTLPKYSSIECMDDAGYFAFDDSNQPLGAVSVDGHTISIYGHGYVRSDRYDSVYWNFSCDGSQQLDTHGDDGNNGYHITYLLRPGLSGNNYVVDFYITGRSVTGSGKSSSVLRNKGNLKSYEYMTSLYIVIGKAFPGFDFDNPSQHPNLKDGSSGEPGKSSTQFTPGSAGQSQNSGNSELFH